MIEFAKVVKKIFKIIHDDTLSPQDMEELTDKELRKLVRDCYQEAYNDGLRDGLYK